MGLSSLSPAHAIVTTSKQTASTLRVITNIAATDVDAE